MVLGEWRIPQQIRSFVLRSLSLRLFPSSSSSFLYLSLSSRASAPVSLFPVTHFGSGFEFLPASPHPLFRIVSSIVWIGCRRSERSEWDLKVQLWISLVIFVFHFRDLERGYCSPQGAHRCCFFSAGDFSDLMKFPKWKKMTLLLFTSSNNYCV